MSAEFSLPSWLRDQDAETIQRRMMENLPPDIDRTEGGFPWDFTMPTALEKAEMLEFFLPETLKIMFPQWAYGEWLDLHAESVGLTRRDASHASGYLTVNGVAGTEIPENFLFAVPIINDSPAVEFAAQKTTVIGKSGVINVPVTAVSGGLDGNVPAGSIAIMVKPIAGITGVTNPESLTGGTETEDDETLRARILEIYRNAGNSFVGCDADYIRWAKEVDGVGSVLIDTQYEKNHPNHIRLTLLDSNGFPASESIREAVYKHIMHPEDRSLRLAPIGAVLSVEEPPGVEIDYKINNLTLSDGAEKTEILRIFCENLRNYYPTAKEENTVRYSRICAILSRIDGVIDFSEITITAKRNSIEIPMDKTKNIEIRVNEYPITRSVRTEDEEIQLFGVEE